MIPSFLADDFIFDTLREGRQEGASFINEVRVIDWTESRVVSLVLIWSTETSPMADPAQGDEIPSVSVLLGRVLEPAWTVVSP
jgi:hypothetical protein